MNYIAQPSGYRLAVRTAVVAGVFSLVIAAMLVLDYTRRMAKDPLDSKTFAALKDALAAVQDDRLRLADEDRRNKQLKGEFEERFKTQIRALDLELREEYFRQRGFTEWGSYLLLCGVVVLLIAGKTAATISRKLPMPGPPAPSGHDPEAQTSATARWAVVVLAVMLAGVAVVLIARCRTPLPADVRQLAAILEGGTPKAPLPDGGEGPVAPAERDTSSTPPTTSFEPDYPSEEEIRAGWLRFRGPGGAGISPYALAPTAWNAASGEGIVWKTSVGLPGNNSPVVCGKYVFLSGATEQRREVYCFDAAGGKLLWQRDVPGTPQSTVKPPEVQEDTGYAAPTTTTDGRRVFAMFANGDVVALDYGGSQVWARSLGIPENSYGHAASLTMYEDLLLIQFDQGGAKAGKSRLMALNAQSGKTAWEVKRLVPNSWASPIVFDHEDRSQVVTCADPWVIAYNPADGTELWRAKCLTGDVGVSPVFAAGVVHVGNEYCEWSAIRADGSGDVTKTHVLWTAEEGLPDTCSPLVTEKHVFLMPSWSTLTCYDVTSGKLLWEQDFEDGSFMSSPSEAGGRVYLFGTEGKAWVVEPGPTGCKTVGKGDLGEGCVTSPAFAEGRFYIRGKKHLFCIGER